MGSVQIVLCVIAALASTAYGDECVKCLGRNREDCEVVENTECGVVDCMAISERCIVEGKAFPTLALDCANQDLCGQHLKFSTLHDEVNIAVFVECCTGGPWNVCLKYNIPEDQDELNGKSCPSCFEKDIMGACISSERVPCRGNQNKCFSYAGTVERADLAVVNYSMQGCISEIGCILGLKALPGIREIEQRVFQCSEPLDSSE